MSPLKLFRYTLLFSLLILGSRASQADPLTVYDDQLQNGFTLWGWTGLVYDLNQYTTVKYGWRAISMEPDFYRALFLHRDAGINSSQYSGIEFWIHGGAAGGQKLRIWAVNGGTPIGSGERLDVFLPGGSLPAGQWVRVRVPFAKIGALSGTFDGIWIQGDVNGDQPGVVIDDIELLSPASNTVYDDQLRNGFADWGWAPRDFAQTSVVHSGGAAIYFKPNKQGAIFFHRDAGISFSDYTGIELWIHGGTTGGQKLQVGLVSVGTPLAQVPLDPYIAGGVVPAGRWAQARIPFSAFGDVSGVDGFWIQEAADGDQPPVYVDDVQLTLGSVKVQISPDAARRPVSPLIYGVNFGSKVQADRMRWPVRRWGGNATTRYSWLYDVANRGFDWFFLNAPSTLPVPPSLPYGSAADTFVTETRAAGGEALVTLPTIGWTPVDGQRRPGFPVDKYGPQQKTECSESGNAPWCDPNAGNGVHPDGSFVTGNDPHDTSREADPTFVTDWMAHLASQFGTASQGGVRYYALDNEPMLWDSTHRDVHPAPVTYDELWRKTVEYASAIKAQDSAAQIFGPVTWGWCDLFASAADHPGDCTMGDDRAAHGDLPLVEWYLQQVRDYELAHGVRLVDWVDLHFYPQGPGITLSNDEGSSASLRRLRSLRGLYDPSYVDESWIGQPVNLIPRVKQWINNRLPGARLAITEYNWGADQGLSSALAQAEALAIFGREGVGLAARWEAPAEFSRVEDAFRLYLNYDGQGGRVSGSSVKTTSSQVDAVGAYSVWADNSVTDRLYVLLFNKETVQRRVDVALTTWGTAGTQPTLFRFDEAGGLRQVTQPVTVTAKGFAMDLPPRSATLVVLPLCAGGRLCF